MAGTEAGGKKRRNNSREKPASTVKSAKGWIEVKGNKTGFTQSGGNSVCDDQPTT